MSSRATLKGRVHVSAAVSPSSSPRPPRPPRRLQHLPCCSTSSEKDSWLPRNVPSQGPAREGGENHQNGFPPPPPPRNPPPWSASFWLPSDGRLRNRRTILAAVSLLGGSFLLRKALPGSSEPPRLYVDDETGQRYLMTEGGAQLALFEDEKGRPYFLDPKGNMWYDSGDPDVGMHRIAPDGDVFALWEDPKSGEVLERRLGNIDSDLVDVKTKEYGDITVFKDFENTQDLPPLCKDDYGNLVKCLDPSGNIRADKDLEYPDVLLEGQIKNLERRKKLFGKEEAVRPGDKDVTTFRQGDIGPLDLGLFD